MLRRPGGARTGALMAIVALAAVVAPGGVAVATAGSAVARQRTGAAVNPLSQPVAIIKAGKSLYLLDRNAVGRFDLTSSTYSTFAGTRHLAGSADGTGAGARFNAPQGITTDGTSLYVADTGNDTVRRIVIATRVVSTIAGRAGSPGSADGSGTNARFKQPSGIAADGGDLWIADRANFTVRKLTLATVAVTTRAGVAGQAGSVDGTGAAARFVAPRAVVTEPGAVWVTDGPKVRRVVMGTGQVTSLASVKKPGLATSPTGIAVAGGDVYVATFFDDHDDTTSAGIRRVSKSTGAVSDFPVPQFRDATGLTVSGNGTKLLVTGHGNFFPSLYKSVIATGTSSDLATFNATGHVDGTGASARFAFPRDVASDGAHLYVTDRGNGVVRKVDIATGAASTLATGLGSPAGVGTNGTSLFVADGNKIKKVVIGSGAVSTLATLGGGTVNDVTVAGSDLYVVFSDCALYKIPIATGAPRVFAGSAGTCGSADGTGTSARFGADVTCPACPPPGITNDGTNLYVADHLTVRKVVIASAVVTTLTSPGPRFDPQLDITVAAGDIYVTRLFNIVKVAISGGTVTDVTARGDEFDHVAYAPSLASTTYAPEVQGIVATPDGHRLFFTDRTGVGVIED